MTWSASGVGDYSGDRFIAAVARAARARLAGGGSCEGLPLPSATVIDPPATVRATRYVTPLREGGSLPALVEADDDGLYVLKFRGAGQGPKALVAELIGGEIGRRLGLLVPEIVLVDLDPELGARRARPGDPGPAAGERRAQPGARLPAGLARLRSRRGLRRWTPRWPPTWSGSTRS